MSNWGQFHQHIMHAFLSSISLITFGFAFFWRQNIGKKVLNKMLMKLTPGVP